MLWPDLPATALQPLRTLLLRLAATGIVIIGLVERRISMPANRSADGFILYIPVVHAERALPGRPERVDARETLWCAARRRAAVGKQ